MKANDHLNLLDVGDVAVLIGVDSFTENKQKDDESSAFGVCSCKVLESGCSKKTSRGVIVLAIDLFDVSRIERTVRLECEVPNILIDGYIITDDERACA